LATLDINFGQARYNSLIISKSEIIAELPNLSPEELMEVRAKLDELAGNAWHDRGELSDADKQALDASGQLSQIAGCRQLLEPSEGPHQSGIG
jgi:hypothetical protein